MASCVGSNGGDEFTTRMAEAVIRARHPAGTVIWSTGTNFAAVLTRQVFY